MRVARLTVDLLRPVPVATLDIETEVVREGRKIQLLQVRLLHEGKDRLLYIDQSADLSPRLAYGAAATEIRAASLECPIRRARLCCLAQINACRMAEGCFDETADHSPTSR